MASNEFAELHRSLAETKIKLREAQDALPVARARAERRAIDAAVAAAQAVQAVQAAIGNGKDKEKEVNPDKVMGSNDTARDRAMLLALADDIDYQAAVNLVRGLQAGVDRLEAELEISKDEHRDRKWSILDRLTTVLDRHGIDVEEPGQIEEEVSDDVATELATQQIVHQVSETSTETSTADDPDPSDSSFFSVFDTAFDDAESAGAEGEAATPDLPPLDPATDPIARMVNGLNPTLTQSRETRMGEEWMSKLADWQAAIGGCVDIAELASLGIEMESDVDMDDQMRERLNVLYESRKKVLLKAKK